MKQLVHRICKDLLTTKNEAEVIAARLLNCSKHELYFHTVRDSHLQHKLKSQLAQMKNGKPIEYVTRTTSFLDLDLNILPGVFIPRLETEFLIEIVKNKMVDAPRKILEIGTGTGAISIALARIFAECMIIANDISERALQCAHINIKKYELEKRIMLCRADRFSGIKGSYDLIISNPPYISQERLNGLQKSVRDFEPIIALDGGFNGIEIIAAIILNGYEMINEQGNIALEIDDHQVGLIRDLLILNKINNYIFLKDLFGRFRYLYISKKII